MNRPESKPPPVALFDPGPHRDLGLVAANLLAEPFGVLAADEDLAVDEPTRSLPEKAFALDGEAVALTIEDRERILWAVDDVRTDALAGLRGVLLQQHEWRAREGLV